MSAWVKFLDYFPDYVPQPNYSVGFKIFGSANNDWVSGMIPNEWKWVSQVGPVVPGVDFNRLIYIFDGVT